MTGSLMLGAGRVELRPSWQLVVSTSWGWIYLSRCSISPGTRDPQIKFEEGRLDALPFEAEVFAGAVCWYSIIYTPPESLPAAFRELARVLMPAGYLLLAFQAESEPVYRTNAHGTHLPLTSYRHSVKDVADLLVDMGFAIYATVLRAPDLEDETSFQGFVLASRPTS